MNLAVRGIRHNVGRFAPTVAGNYLKQSSNETGHNHGNTARASRRPQRATHPMLEIYVTRKLLGEGLKRPRRPFIQMCEEVWRKIDAVFGENGLRLSSLRLSS